jgi:methionine-rich copper-binding protein CopC
VNSTTANDQWADGEWGGRAGAALNNGGFVVVWSSDTGNVTNLTDVLAQRYDASGAEVGSAFRVNATQANMQTDASVTTLANGNFVVTWSALGQDGSGFGVYGQIYTQAGATVGGEFRLNTTTSNSQNHASVTALSDGGFVAVWTNEFSDARLFDVYARRFNDSGTAIDTPSGTPVNTNNFQIGTVNTNDQNDPVVTALENGRYVVTWSSWGQDGDDWGVYGRVYDANGNGVGSSDFRVNTTTSDAQHYSASDLLESGGFVVTWSSFDQDGDGYGVYFQRFDSSGNKLGGEVRANTTTDFSQVYSSVVGLGDGNFLVTWQSTGQDVLNGSGSGIYAREFNADGSAASGEFRINQTTALSQKHPHLIELSGGDVVAIWSGNGPGDSEGVFARILDYG